METPGHYHVITELAVGVTLEDYLKIHGKLELRSVVAIFNQLASALKYCHNSDICHRDVKLSNTMIDGETGHVTLIDFGLSNWSQFCRTSCGTLLYNAPEVIMGKYEGPRADCWAAGVVLYALLTGT